MPPSVCEGSGEGRERRKIYAGLTPRLPKKVQNFSPKQHSLEVSKAFSGTKNAVNGKLQVNLTRKIRYRDLWRKKSIFDAISIFFLGKQGMPARNENIAADIVAFLAGTIRLIIWKRRRRRLGLMMIRECGWVGKKKGNRKSTSFTQKKKANVRTGKKERSLCCRKYNQKPCGLW